MILLIDNYDSFVHNLARYFRRLGQTTRVVRNDALSLGEIQSLAPQAVVLSPGPCTPQEAGCSLAVVREFSGRIPLLGVCLGHQTIAAALGGEVVRAREPRHGRTSVIDHAGDGLFRSLPQALEVCRYHSLAVREATLPAVLKVTARASDGEVMALEHRTHLTWGVQFHPEAVLTQGGYRLLANFLELSGCSVPPNVPDVAHESSSASCDEADWSQLRLTF
jgi:anthranilate synthase/aminodeoxychorismate synthase-like glutamine amidotransferase